MKQKNKSFEEMHARHVREHLTFLVLLQLEGTIMYELVKAECVHERLKELGVKNEL